MQTESTQRNQQARNDHPESTHRDRQGYGVPGGRTRRGLRAVNRQSESTQRGAESNPAGYGVPGRRTERVQKAVTDESETLAGPLRKMGQLFVHSSRKERQDLAVARRALLEHFGATPQGTAGAGHAERWSRHHKVGAGCSKTTHVEAKCSFTVVKAYILKPRSPSGRGL